MRESRRCVTFAPQVLLSAPSAFVTSPRLLGPGIEYSFLLEPPPFQRELSLYEPQPLVTSPRSRGNSTTSIYLPPEDYELQPLVTSPRSRGNSTTSLYLPSEDEAQDSERLQRRRTVSSVLQPRALGLSEPLPLPRRSSFSDASPWASRSMHLLGHRTPFAGVSWPGSVDAAWPDASPWASRSQRALSRASWSPRISGASVVGLVPDVHATASPSSSLALAGATTQPRHALVSAGETMNFRLSGGGAKE